MRVRRKHSLTGKKHQKKKDRSLAGHAKRHLPIRMLTLMGGTVLVSAFYKAMIEIGIFKLVHGTERHRLVYCAFELLLLLGFWYCVYRFSKKCRHRAPSLKTYYLMASVLAVVYAGICCVLYYFLSREMYSWLLRLTLNLCALRFRTSFPDDLTPYLAAYLVITILIMLLEPTIAKKLYKRAMHKGESAIGKAVRDRIDQIQEKRYKKWKEKRRRRQRRLRERENRE